MEWTELLFAVEDVSNDAKVLKYTFAACLETCLAGSSKETEPVIAGLYGNIARIAERLDSLTNSGFRTLKNERRSSDEKRRI